jgi:hypothetical protein
VRIIFLIGAVEGIFLVDRSLESWIDACEWPFVFQAEAVAVPRYVGTSLSGIVFVKSCVSRCHG